MPRPKSKNPRSRVVNFRLTDCEYGEMEAAASSAGFSSLSDYLRRLHMDAVQSGEPDGVKEQGYLYDLLEPKSYEETEFGVVGS